MFEIWFYFKFVPVSNTFECWNLSEMNFLNIKCCLRSAFRSSVFLSVLIKQFEFGIGWWIIRQVHTCPAKPVEFHFMLHKIWKHFFHIHLLSLPMIAFQPKHKSQQLTDNKVDDGLCISAVIVDKAPERIELMNKCNFIFYFLESITVNRTVYGW